MTPQEHPDAVSLEELEPLDQIIVTTRNHTYEILVVSPEDGTVVVRGGRAFPSRVTARLDGCSMGGATIKVRSIAVGLRVEFATNNHGQVITTPVTTLAVIPAAADAHAAPIA
jgi:hypothetical protein